MLTPVEIKRKAKRQYKDFLRAMLRREQFFPLHIKGSKGKASTPLEELFPQLRRLLEGAKDKTGFGYTVTLKRVNTRHAGNISMPEDIFFANVEDYLKFIEKEEEFLKFRKAVQLTQRQVPALIDWMQDNLAVVLQHIGYWENLLKVVVFFEKNPLPQQYSRALPIDVPAVFIEEHETILTNLLKYILPPTAQRAGSTFAECFGLKQAETLLEFRALDKNIFPNFPTQITQLALPLSLAKSLIVNTETVFIITDKMNWLRFPEKEKALAIYGNEATLQVLPQIEWLQDKAIYLWGDISLNGLQQLSQLRQLLPQAKAFLMAKDILEKYIEWVEIEKNDVENIPLLEKVEYELFLELRERKIKLNQKNILHTELNTF